MSPNHEHIREMIVYFLKPLAHLYNGFLTKRNTNVERALDDLDKSELFAEAIRDYIEGVPCYCFLKEFTVMQLSNLYESLPASRLSREEF